MATLAVRPLSPRDLLALRHVRQHVEWLALPDVTDATLDIARLARAALPVPTRRTKVFVAAVDGELCAYVAVAPDEHRFVWNVECLASGSPRLEATEAVSLELWEALLELVIARAGEAHVRRVFAAACEDSVAWLSLRAAGFEAYTRLTIMLGRAPGRELSRPRGMRRQERSDEWALHQLYHRVTPRAVQFAEARTSATWELRREVLLDKVVSRADEPAAFVLEAPQGVCAYCQVRRGAGLRHVELLIEPRVPDAVGFVEAALAEAGASPDERTCVVIPAYAAERVSQFLDAGYVVGGERLALIRHTTSAARVRMRLAPLPALDVAERAPAPAGIPSYS